VISLDLSINEYVAFCLLELVIYEFWISEKGSNDPSSGTYIVHTTVTYLSYVYYGPRVGLYVCTIRLVISVCTCEPIMVLHYTCILHKRISLFE
jgi:hypothetical protein